MPDNRESTTYNEIIGVAGGEIVVLTDLFKYSGSSLKGATGFTIETLTDEQVTEMKDPENLKDLWIEAVKNEETTESLEDWANHLNELYSDYEQYCFSDDPSFRREMNKAYDKLTDENRAKIDELFGIRGKDFLDWNSRSCGRCIPTKESDYTILFRPDLLKLIQEYEEKQTGGGEKIAPKSPKKSIDK